MITNVVKFAMVPFHDELKSICETLHVFGRKIDKLSDPQPIFIDKVLKNIHDDFSYLQKLVDEHQFPNLTNLQGVLSKSSVPEPTSEDVPVIQKEKEEKDNASYVVDNDETEIESYFRDQVQICIQVAPQVAL